VAEGLRDVLHEAGFEQAAGPKGGENWAHNDGRSVLLTAGPHTEEWAARDPGGKVDKGATPQGLRYRLGLKPRPTFVDHGVLLKHGFVLAREQDGSFGYTHPDGRAALYSPNGGSNKWALVSADGVKHEGQGEGSLALALDTTPVPRTVTETPATRAVKFVQALKKEFDLTRLAADKKYTDRVRLLKTLTGRDKILAKDASYTAFRKAAFAALGAKDMADFMTRADDLRKTAGREQGRLDKAERARVAGLLKNRPAVPGPAPVAVKRISNRRRAIEKEELRQELAETCEMAPLAVPRADVEVTIREADLEVLEDPENRIRLLRLEPANSQGALCVYNNGVRVAAGVATQEMLKKLRHAPGSDPLEAANRLLHPAKGIAVTPVAARHLTAVLDCKETDTMATKKSTKKFAPPAKAAKKSAKKTEAAGPRKTSLFRLVGTDYKEFTGQKGEIVAAFQKLGAIGAKAAGVTRGQLIEALPNVPAPNISFYLSRWQEPGIVEKLAPAA